MPSVGNLPCGHAGAVPMRLVANFEPPVSKALKDNIHITRKHLSTYFTYEMDTVGVSIWQK